MKVIDLLNKIANGEKLPETIKYRSGIYHKFNQSGYFYAKSWEEETLLDNIQCTSDLTEKIEIIDPIEEEKEIEEIEFDEIDEMTDFDIYFYPECSDDSKENFKNKINELIRNQKKIIDKLKKGK